MIRSGLILAVTLLAGAAFAQEPPPPSTPSAAPSASVPPAGQGVDRAPQSPQMRSARKAARQACMPDAAKLCSTVEPGRGAVMQCLRAHKTELSQGCGSALRAVREARKDEG